MARWPHFESWKTPACFFMISARPHPCPYSIPEASAHINALLDDSCRTLLHDVTTSIGLHSNPCEPVVHKYRRAFAVLCS